MPVFVGALVGQVTNIEAFALGVGLGQFAIPELQRAGAEVIAQLDLRGLHVWVCRMVMDGKSLKRGASADLGRVARFDDHAL
jgi:DNA-binding helix-hairpin-helix protein with protein kinase domain